MEKNSQERESFNTVDVLVMIFFICLLIVTLPILKLLDLHNRPESS